MERMSIINRRNAIFGWLAWNAAKRYGRMKASSRVAGDDGTRTARTARTAGLAALVATAVGALVFWRRRRDDDPAENSG